MKRIIMDVPRWNVLQHRDERRLDMPDDRDTPRLRFEDELFDRLYSGAEDLEFLEADEVTSNFAQWALQAHGQAEGLPRYKRLADEVRGDSYLAAAAAEAIMGELNAPDPETDDDPTPPPPSEQDMRRALTRGLLQARAAVDEAGETRESFEGIGWGNETGEHAAGDPNRTREVLAKVKGNRRLLEIAKLAGRMKRIAAHKRRSKVRHGADELQDIEQGGEIARLIPAELAKLASPKLKLALMRDVIERKALQYRLDGSETQGKGPLVVCLDKSGSMSGDPDVWATAVALALFDRAQREKRVFALVCFDSCVLYNTTVQPGGKLPAEALYVQPQGGTEVNVALRVALATIQANPAKLKQADVILITDGHCDFDPTLREGLKGEGAQILGFGIGVPREYLLAWADQAWAIENLHNLDDGAADALFAHE